MYHSYELPRRVLTVSAVDVGPLAAGVPWVPLDPDNLGVCERSRTLPRAIEESSTGEHANRQAREAVSYLYLPDNKTLGWYYISKTTKRTPLNFDSGNADKVGRVKYFMDSVEALAADEPK